MQCNGGSGTYKITYINLPWSTLSDGFSSQHESTTHCSKMPPGTCLAMDNFSVLCLKISTYWPGKISTNRLAQLARFPNSVSKAFFSVASFLPNQTKSNKNKPKAAKNLVTCCICEVRFCCILLSGNFSTYSHLTLTLLSHLNSCTFQST